MNRNIVTDAALKQLKYCSLVILDFSVILTFRVNDSSRTSINLVPGTVGPTCWSQEERAEAKIPSSVYRPSVASTATQLSCHAFVTNIANTSIPFYERSSSVIFFYLQSALIILRGGTIRSINHRPSPTKFLTARARFLMDHLRTTGLLSLSALGILRQGAGAPVRWILVKKERPNPSFFKFFSTVLIFQSILFYCHHVWYSWLVACGWRRLCEFLPASTMTTYFADSAMMYWENVTFHA
jgi:hypothetical protein